MSLVDTARGWATARVGLEEADGGFVEVLRARMTIPVVARNIAPGVTMVGLALVTVLSPGPLRSPSIALGVVTMAIGVVASLTFHLGVDHRRIGRVDLDMRAAAWLLVLAALTVGVLPSVGQIHVGPMRAIFVVGLLGIGLFTSSRAAWRSHPALGVWLAHHDAPRPHHLRTPVPPVCAAFKRATDVMLSLIALVIVAPVMAVAAVAIMLESRGGWLFVQTRVGKSGRPFRMYKLRTMYCDNDDSGHRAYVAALIRGESDAFDGKYKLTDDPRLTRVGRVLRKLSLDELPQFLNVLKGDMSIVGPRPPIPTEVELYDGFAWARMELTPGLTGLWQVSGRSRLTFAEMVELDVRYGQQWTPLLDLRIILRTPKVMLWARETA